MAVHCAAVVFSFSACTPGTRSAFGCLVSAAGEPRPRAPSSPREKLKHMMAWSSKAVITLLHMILAGVVAWDEPVDAFLDLEDTFAELAAEDRGSDGAALNLLQATAKLHHRGTGSIPDLSGGGSLSSATSPLEAAAADGRFESIEGSTVSLVQQVATRTDQKGFVKKAQASRKVLLTKKEEL
eukprot:s2447_g5.t1